MAMTRDEACKILKLDPNQDLTDEIINKAFRPLVREFHPDKTGSAVKRNQLENALQAEKTLSPAQREAKQKQIDNEISLMDTDFNKITEAHVFLMDPANQKVIAYNPDPFFRPRPATQPSRRSDDLWNDFFNSFFRNQSGAPRPSPTTGGFRGSPPPPPEDTLQDFFKFIRYHDIQKTKKILNAHPEYINQKFKPYFNDNDEGITPLMESLKNTVYHDVTILKILLASPKIDLFIKTTSGKNALDFASSKIAAKILAQAMLFKAISTDNIPEIENVIKKYPDWKSLIQNGQTAMTYAQSLRKQLSIDLFNKIAADEQRKLEFIKALSDYLKIQKASLLYRISTWAVIGWIFKFISVRYKKVTRVEAYTAKLIKERNTITFQTDAEIEHALNNDSFDYQGKNCPSVRFGLEKKSGLLEKTLKAALPGLDFTPPAKCKK